MKAHIPIYLYEWVEPYGINYRMFITNISNMSSEKLQIYLPRMDLISLSVLPNPFQII
jgi:hypothetical protein